MAAKPKTAAGYDGHFVALVKSTCLYLATKLGDVMNELIVVGGLAPSLLIDQENLPEGIDAHVGTMDLDIGLTLALLDNGRYHTLTGRLRGSGFSQDVNDKDNPTRQRWLIRGGEITVDFLIQPSLPNDKGGSLRNIEPDFAAVIVPGLHLAFRDRKLISLSGQTIMGEHATRDVWVCGPGAYVVLKALAFRERGENKDAYDLFYMIRNSDDIAENLKPLLDDALAQEALDELHNDFLDWQGIGPRRVAEFITGSRNDDLQADVVGYVRQLLKACGKLP